MEDKSTNVSGPVAGDLSSCLFASVVDFWSQLLRQESWLLSFSPQPPAPETIEHYTAEENEQRSQDLDMNDESLYSEDNASDITRFLLNEERDRLCLWKFQFSDEDLNLLNQTEPNVFGGAVIQCLLSIGEALTRNTVINSCGESSRDLEASKATLDATILEGKRHIRSVYYEEDIAETLVSTGYEGSVATDYTVPDDKPTSLHESVKIEIGKLQRLSFPISQTIAGMKD
ncbi:hypothetical protein LZ30DRAFT_770510 [Colletotrichum cereale]|nr:hypothetical protein LZ30DRAFT_770510 [Colletotrichum cereale]